MNAEKVVNYIVSWLKEYAEKSNVNGFVIGISGGIDSAVTSTLCAKTGFQLQHLIALRLRSAFCGLFAVGLALHWLNTSIGIL